MTMVHTLFYIALFLCLDIVSGGGCDAETGSINSPQSLGGNEQSLADTGLAVRLRSYSTSCACGIITRWSFYTRRNGTVIFYALQSNTVKGKTSISVPELSHDNYYEVPLSSQMWISVQSGYTLGFVTPDLPMITFGTANRVNYRNTGRSEVAVGSTENFGSYFNDNEYAVRAYIERAHAPMFTNLPYTVSVYTHDALSNIHIITVSATDLDPDDVSSLSFSATYSSAYFSFNPGTGEFSYTSVYTASTTFTMTVTVSDSCSQRTTELLKVELINEPPTFTNLPATQSIAEKGSGSSNIFTITTFDPAGETVRCYLDTTDATILSRFTLEDLTKVLTVNYPTTNGGFVHDSRPSYDLPIRCSDTNNNVFSSLNIDIIKNNPPVYSGATGFLPASKVVGRNSPATLYPLAASDSDGGTLIYSKNSCSSTYCPITVDPATGVVSSTATLMEAYYDLVIDVSDTYSTVSKTLTILVSDDPDFNNQPLFGNLPATIYVTENTPANTPLFKLLYYEIDTWDSLTFSTSSVSHSSANTYFQMDPTTQIVSVKAPFDYDTVSPNSLTINYRIQDPDGAGDTQALTINYVNENEAPTISIATTTITINEGVRGDVFTDPGLNVADPDAGDAASCKWSLDCGADSKYFYINDATRTIHLAREYDMDAGLIGNATCVVAVIDPDGLSSTTTVTLSINNINDNDPKFPHQRYLFLQNPDDPFFQRVENLAATDADSNNFGSALGTITYSFDTTNYPASTTYYQMDVNGVLYVRDVSSFSRGDKYTFKVFAADSGGRTGTATISILFAEVESVTTTTTKRPYVFGDDFGNYIWLFIVAIFISCTLVIIAFMVWFDPVVHDFVAFKLMRIDECCRHKPKEPKRTVGKLTLTINNKTLENDPDNALPWELAAKDADVPEMNHVQEEITRRKERREMDYMKLTGRNIFEKGKGIRPATAEVDVHDAPSDGRSSESPRYDSFELGDANGQINDGFDDGGPSNWERQRSVASYLHVTPIQEDEQETNVDDVSEPSQPLTTYNYNGQDQPSHMDF